MHVFFLSNQLCSVPIPSMYGIYIYIYLHLVVVFFYGFHVVRNIPFPWILRGWELWAEQIGVLRRKKTVKTTTLEDLDVAHRGKFGAVRV